MNDNKQLQTIIDGVLYVANKNDVEIVVDDYSTNSAVVLQNIGTKQIGIIGECVKEFPDEPVSFFLLNSKLYKYCVQEGFNQTQMLEGFDDKVLQKVTLKEFTDQLTDK